MPNNKLDSVSIPAAAVALEIPPRKKPSNYPQEVQELLRAKLAGREKRPLGDFFQLTNFGVNLTRLAPGAMSALRHAHAVQDEFIYILEGAPTLITNEGRFTLAPGMCAGFPKGTGNGHHLVNESANDVLYLEIGDRTPGDTATYPDDDLLAKTEGGVWNFFHKDGRAY